MLTVNKIDIINTTFYFSECPIKCFFFLLQATTEPGDMSAGNVGVLLGS